MGISKFPNKYLAIAIVLSEPVSLFLTLTFTHTLASSLSIYLSVCLRGRGRAARINFLQVVLLIIAVLTDTWPLCIYSNMLSRLFAFDSPVLLFS